MAEVIIVGAKLRRYELTDMEWDRVEEYFSNPQKTGRPPSDPRTILNGIFWIMRSGAPWRDMPERYGPYTTVYGWFARWETEGLIEKIMSDQKADADLQDMGMDSTCSKAHQHAAGAKRGRKMQKQDRLLE